VWLKNIAKLEEFIGTFWSLGNGGYLGIDGINYIKALEGEDGE